jgi:hypothetical protein
MMGLTVTLVGVVIGVAGWASLRRVGTGWRIGRLLSAAPQRSLGDAIALADRGEQAYIRLHGRIDSDEEFPGDDDKPLVFRRRRLQRQVRRWTGGSDWQTIDDERLAVPFRLSERGEHVAIDVAALGDGLVVVPRVSLGVAADLPPGGSNGPLPLLPPEMPVSMRLEQVSAVDHGTACGVPRLSASGETVLGPGFGRPLILTTLDSDEAMRILGAGQRTSLLLASGLLLVAPVLVVTGLLMTVSGL